MRSFDLTPLLRSTVGFENLNRLVDMASRIEQSDLAYPPYDIEKISDDEYSITMAVAGFRREDIDITVQENTLFISAKVSGAETEREYLHRGIAKRAFERQFELADTIKVTGAAMNDGLLTVGLVREVPEHKRPRQIEIGNELHLKAVEGTDTKAA
ncbi:MAG: Hsp20 family protein [Pseudomonadota bacterium]